MPFSELPVLDLIDLPIHEMNEDQRREFVEALRSARVNSHVLKEKIAREKKPKASSGSKPATPRINIDDLV